MFVESTHVSRNSSVTYMKTHDNPFNPDLYIFFVINVTLLCVQSLNP